MAEIVLDDTENRERDTLFLSFIFEEVVGYTATSFLRAPVMHQFKANSQVRARQRRALTDVVTLNKRDNNALDSMQQTSPTSQQLIILRFSQNDGPNHLGMILGSRS
ncbi:unnamed protein product [Rhizopus microsporus]|nr:hypothetical protein RMCBS344292_13741 [Rhizopus microsporus]